MDQMIRFERALLHVLWHAGQHSHVIGSFLGVDQPFLWTLAITFWHTLCCIGRYGSSLVIKVDRRRVFVMLNYI